MKIRMRNPEFPLYFIGELGFGIFLFLKILITEALMSEKEMKMEAILL